MEYQIEREKDWRDRLEKEREDLGSCTIHVSALAKRMIANPLQGVVCDSESGAKAYRHMGVPLKQIHIVTGKDVELAILRKIHKRGEVYSSNLEYEEIR